MEDLIVIILTLIVVVVGALGQGKKKKKQIPEGEAESNGAESFWDMIGGDEPAVVSERQWIDQEEQQESIEPEPQYDMETGVSTEDPNYQFNAEDEGGIAVTPPMVGDLKKKQFKSKIRQEFSLKKAVIYSEILNRKYN